MEFGPEIKVDGKRPDYVRDDDQVKFRYFDYGHWSQLEWSACEVDWKFDWLKLPTNHPHYTTPTPDERAVALVKRMAKTYGGTMSADYAEARSIVAALEPVDVDLQMAKQIGQKYGLFVVNADQKNDDITNALHESLLRGRQLEKEGK